MVWKVSRQDKFALQAFHVVLLCFCQPQARGFEQKVTVSVDFFSSMIIFSVHLSERFSFAESCL